MKKEAIIFDMDGVLVDTEKHHKEIEHGIFQDLGITISEKEREPYIGMAADELWAAVIDHYKLDRSHHELLDINNQRILDYFTNKVDLQPIDGVIPVLDWIKKHKIPLAVASSSSSIVIDALLKETGLDKYFAIRVGGQTVEKSKPEPYIYLHTAELLQVNPERCLVIEDSSNGIAAAKAANMYCVGYRGTGYSQQDQSHADELISHYDELIPRLQKAFETT
ncbi:HAD family phosphatase [Membranicola marinus]|uniref:HAD family phosphatase n=1 Tax=Membranihabitans marinus TaxID=1227546 RepID=A0A953L7Z8_9BACT|nr:HAD family phosphatase [Membranihabitans marinus]MBY5957150.1 HAD family phosphatase [Membranihabitans marinus]